MSGEEHKIELWSWGTPNGWKVEIALNEIGVPYKVYIFILLYLYLFESKKMYIRPFVCSTSISLSFFLRRKQFTP